MTDSEVLGKEKSAGDTREPEDHDPSPYYYDDATGYRVYDPEADDDTEDEQAEDD